MFSAVLICISLFFGFMMLRSMYMFISGRTRTILGVFVSMLGMFLTLILLMYRDLAEETFIIFRNAFIKSVESKTPLELAIWSMVLIVIMLTPVLKKIFK
jgi:hypothetical protein